MTRAIIAVGVLCVAALGEASGQVGIIEFASKGRGDTLQAGRGARPFELPQAAVSRMTRPYGGPGLHVANGRSLRTWEMRGVDRIYFASSGGANLRDLSTPTLGVPLFTRAPRLGLGTFIGFEHVFSSDASVRFSVAAASDLFDARSGVVDWNDAGASRVFNTWVTGAAGGTLALSPTIGVAIVPANFSRPVLRSTNGIDLPEPRTYMPAVGVIAAGVLGVGVIVRVRRG